MITAGTRNLSSLTEGRGARNVLGRYFACLAVLQSQTNATTTESPSPLTHTQPGQKDGDVSFALINIREENANRIFLCVTSGVPREGGLLGLPVIQIVVVLVVLGFLRVTVVIKEHLGFVFLFCSWKVYLTLQCL